MDRKIEIEQLEQSHTPAAVRKRLAAGSQHSYLRDFIYGAIDGTITTFAIVAGVAGAGLSAGIALVLGLANLLADGFSMAVSNYLATRADEEMRDRARRMEEMHIKTVPEGEREEIRQILAKKGFAGEDLERGVDVITSDVQRWVDTMLQEELGLPLVGPSPWRAATVTFIAFVAIGMIPLAAFLMALIMPISASRAFVWSIVVTSLTFFGIGVVKSRIVGKSTVVGGLETLVVGGTAAGLAYGVGFLLQGLVS